MMKRTLILLAALLLLCGCAGPEPSVILIQPVTFYYRTAQPDFSAKDGVIRAEIRDLGNGSFSDSEIFSKYLEGPVSPDLISPVSQDTKLEKVVRVGSRLDVYLIRDVNSPAELDHTLTDACLAKTGLALDGIGKVRIFVHSQGGAKLSDVVYTGSSFLFFDNGETPDTLEVTLYYADESGRFLLPEKRTVSQMRDEDLATYVLGLLCSEPLSGGMKSPFPPGTALMETVKVENGICSVDFYPEDTPEQEQAQMLAVLSVVNTLCKLDSINQVQIYISGRQVMPGEAREYQYLDLSAPWTADNSVIGPVREELGEFSAVLCLPGLQPDVYLHRLTVRARARGGVSREEALLQMLFERTAQNGLGVPVTDTASIVSVSTKNGVCTVDLGANSLPGDEPARSTAIRSIAASLASLPELDAVLITENGSPVSPEPIRPQSDWFRESGDGLY